MSHPQQSMAKQLTWPRSIVLFTLSFLILPVSLVGLLYNYAALILRPQNGLRRHVQRSGRFRPRTVVITGVATPAGLRVARALYTTGHNVVGVGVGRMNFTHHARWSKAISKYYSIRPERLHNVADYAEDLFRVIVKERARIWIDCSDQSWTYAQARAKETVEDRCSCVCLVAREDHLQLFGTRQGFHQLAQNIGLPSAESYSVHSRNDIYNVLNVSNGKKYLLSSPNGATGPLTRTVIPRRTVSQTFSDLAQMKLSKSAPWTLEQYVEGLQEFTACAIVVKGKVKAFAASSTFCDEYRIVNSKSGISIAMEQYMAKFADAIGPSMSCHLTLQFGLDEKATQTGVVQQLLPQSGSLIAHDNILLFQGKKGAIDLTKAYLALLADTLTELQVYTGLPYTESSPDIAVPSDPDGGVYSVYNAFGTLVVEPTLRMLVLQNSIASVASAWVVFLQRLVTWQESLYAFEDPLPLFWFTHISIPCQLIANLTNDVWSRLRTNSKDRQKRLAA